MKKFDHDESGTNHTRFRRQTAKTYAMHDCFYKEDLSYFVLHLGRDPISTTAGDDLENGLRIPLREMTMVTAEETRGSERDPLSSTRDAATISPAPQNRPQSHTSSAIHGVDFVGTLVPWPNFEGDTIAA
ncbi:hypothetical protein N7519_009006 [Penicillium mononematosum]|uniref:uncharacterized protein n=1 Tax=Penicillium mononematosum TaxID=268346 RepID=UPI0025473868|nr:uncharacterized protein N7519_009006 [Penicillium mononematosum]KAJ6178545.1 hypothetical protein N7519_009006 [Penicillium mononematosum]